MAGVSHSNRTDLLLVIVCLAAVVVLLVGGFIPAVQALLWVGLAVAVVAVLVFLVRVLERRRA